MITQSQTRFLEGKLQNNYNKKGFTLLELLVVMAIVAILVMVLIVAIKVIQQQRRDTQLRTDARAIQTALEAYYAANRKFPSAAPSIDAYTLVGPGKPLEEFIPNTMTNPSSITGATVCYNYGQQAAGYRYYLWVQDEEQVSQKGWTNCPGHYTASKDPTQGGTPNNDFALKN